MYFDTRLDGYYLLVAYEIRVVAILLAGGGGGGGGRRAIGHVFNVTQIFPADVIPAKLKERVIR